MSIFYNFKLVAIVAKDKLPKIIDIDYLGHIFSELLEDIQENGLEFHFCYEIIIDDHSLTKEIANNVVELIKDINKYNWIYNHYYT
ncbi:129_t:CDS:2, partial [Dentiscutata erythropus]